MLKANTRIEVKGKVFTEGQNVTGLSHLDKKWMLEEGYITEIRPDQKQKEEKTSGEDGAQNVI